MTAVHEHFHAKERVARQQERNRERLYVRYRGSSNEQSGSFMSVLSSRCLPPYIVICVIHLAMLLYGDKLSNELNRSILISSSQIFVNEVWLWHALGHCEQFLEVEYSLKRFVLHAVHHHDLECLVVGLPVAEHVLAAVHALELVHFEVHEQQEHETVVVEERLQSFEREFVKLVI